MIKNIKKSEVQKVQKTKKFSITRFSKELRFQMFDRQVTYRELEKISGISNAFLNQVVNHQRTPNIDSIIWLCDWMERDLSCFIDLV